jgi:hypothetical protein
MVRGRERRVARPAGLEPATPGLEGPPSQTPRKWPDCADPDPRTVMRWRLLFDAHVRALESNAGRNSLLADRIGVEADNRSVHLDPNGVTFRQYADRHAG